MPLAAPAADPYAVLGVPRGAAAAAVRAAWRSAALRLHPDKQQGAEGRPPPPPGDAAGRFAAAHAAYELLSDPVRRAEYDRRHSTAAGSPAVARRGWAPGPPRAPAPRPRAPVSADEIIRADRREKAARGGKTLTQLLAEAEELRLVGEVTRRRASGLAGEQRRALDALLAERPELRGDPGLAWDERYESFDRAEEELRRGLVASRLCDLPDGAGGREAMYRLWVRASEEVLARRR